MFLVTAPLSETQESWSLWLNPQYALNQTVKARDDFLGTFTHCFNISDLTYILFSVVFFITASLVELSELKKALLQNNLCVCPKPPPPEYDPILYGYTYRSFDYSKYKDMREYRRAMEKDCLKTGLSCSYY